jgi:hypothetical protein
MNKHPLFFLLVFLHFSSLSKAQIRPFIVTESSFKVSGMGKEVLTLALPKVIN